MEYLTGEIIGRYQIKKLIGKGGMAYVYLARDSRLERNVALKIIRKEAISPKDRESLYKRFQIWVMTHARLNHSNIVKIYDYGEYDGSPYLVMEYINGGTLKDKMKTPISYTQAAEFLSPIANGLDYAHKHGFFHRDVKPANILLRENGTPVLTDFGIAKMLDAEDGQGYTGLTEANMGVGTPDYMSPEQCMGKRVDGRSDEYSLGIIFFEMCSGIKPFNAPTTTGILINQIKSPVPDLSKYVNTLPAHVTDVIKKVLAKDPDERYSTCGEFANELNKISGNLPRICR